MFGIEILKSITDGVGSYFKGRQAIKKAKLKCELTNIRAEANAKLAISEAKIQMAKSGQSNDYSLDKIAMENMGKSYKDEFVLIIFISPMIMAFIPKYSEDALKGFEVISKMPTWYTATIIGMIVVIYGMRGMLKEFLKNKSNILK